MRARRHLVALVVVVVAALAVVGPTGPRPGPAAFDDAARPIVPAIAGAPHTIPELRRRIADVLAREHVPGIAIALVDRDGPIWIGGVGIANEATRAPVTADTVFRAASITKMIVGLGVMHLAEQGRLALDAPLRLPGVTIDNPWRDVAPVTLAETLEHTAGFDDMHFNEWYAPDDAMTPAEALALNPRSRVVRWRPGTRFSYSNVGYTLAARAIEVATGEPFDAYLEREVLRPLGMTGAAFRRTPALAARLATGYVEPDRAAAFRPIAHRAAGALLVSATDLAKLVQFWLRRDGTIVSPAGLARIERCGTLPYPKTDVDYGLGNYGDVGHPARSRGHDGGLPGFLSNLRYFPELGVGYVVLLNATYSFRADLEIRALVYAYLARGRSPSPPAQIVPPEPPDAAFFAFAAPRNELTGFIDRALLGIHPVVSGAGLRLEPLLGLGADVVPAGDGGYRLPGESGSSIRFTHAADGTPVMLFHGMYHEAAPYALARLRVLALLVALALLELAPKWAGVVVLLAALRRKKLVALDLLVWPAIAGLCLTAALPPLFRAAMLRDVLGDVNVITVALWATTLAFATSALAGAVAAVRWSFRPDRPPLASRLVPTAAALAALALAVWLGAHGIIGLRTWAW
jgi:CubicO group peptidase (beta-lactamase class C family)